MFEIGPGTGNMTVHLLNSPAKVVYAVELDFKLHAVLLARVEKLCVHYCIRLYSGFVAARLRKRRLRLVHHLMYLPSRFCTVDAFSCSGLQHKLQCVRGDFLAVPLPAFDVLVANIPYQISSPVLGRIWSLPQEAMPSRCLIMFQKEFAERIVAKCVVSIVVCCFLTGNPKSLCMIAAFGRLTSS